MKKKMSPVVHFEMGYTNKKRMIDFYSNVFGWQPNEMGPEMGNYVVVHTTETDKDGMVKTPGAINGGLYEKTDNPLSHPPSIVISVDNIENAMSDLVKAGGKILGAMDNQGKHTDKPMMIPGVGLWISAMDTEGNRISLMQPNK